MNNQIELCQNQLENTINMDSQQFISWQREHLANSIAEKLGYQNCFI